jgi:hypothetical protein
MKMSKYQVTYKANNKIYYSDIEAKTPLDIQKFFDALSSSELIEIRKYVYETSTLNILDSDMNNSNYVLKCFNEDNQMLDLKIPLVKNEISEDILINTVQNFIKINNKKIRNLTLKVKK